MGYIVAGNPERRSKKIIIKIPGKSKPIEKKLKIQINCELYAELTNPRKKENELLARPIK